VQAGALQVIFDRALGVRQPNAAPFGSVNAADRAEDEVVDAGAHGGIDEAPSLRYFLLQPVLPVLGDPEDSTRFREWTLQRVGLVEVGVDGLCALPSQSLCGGAVRSPGQRDDAVSAPQQRACHGAPLPSGGPHDGHLWRGSLLLQPMVALFIGTGSATARHRHPAHKVVLGAAVTARAGCTELGEASVVAAGALHRVFGSSEEPMVLAYLDARRYRLLDARRLARLWESFDVRAGDARDLLQDAVRVPEWRPSRPVRRMLEALSSQASVAEAAGHSRLSLSRATHRFTEELGVAPRNIRGWLRLRTAVDELVVYSNVARAAHHAGFADGPHLWRSCRANLGVSPSALAGGQLVVESASEPCAGW